MKKSITKLLLISSIMLIGLSCTKQTDVEIDANNLTPCPENTNCENLYSERADFSTEDFMHKQGIYRLFWSNIKSKNYGITSTLYFKAPMEGNSFSLNNKDFTDGRVLLFRSCPSCFMIPFQPVQGYVKGINANPGKPADQTKWLLEAQIILEAEGTAAPLKDTIYIKQYFSPNFVYN